MKRIVYMLFITVVLGGILNGCSLKYDLNPPIISTAEYENTLNDKKIIYVVDKREDTKFIEGVASVLKNVKLEIGNVEEPVLWLSDSLEREFLSHGLNVEFSTDKKLEDVADATLVIHKYKILNSRTSGFHPYVAYHLFSGEILSESIETSVISYFVYGKTPVWSMDEVQEPCFDMPSSILIKGIASKINRLAFNYRMSDVQLEDLNKKTQEKVVSLLPDAYLSVLDIGVSNNPKANKYLMQYAENEDLLIRACALSAIGMVGEESAFGFLKEKYSQYTDIDRFMALKSIGDLGTPEAMHILNEARHDQQYKDEYGFKFLVDLYLERD